MKKLFLFLIIFNLLSVNLNAATFNWTKFNITEEGDTEWFYDKKTILKVGSYRFYWTLTNYLKNIQDNVYSVIGHHMVNCGTNESKWITYTSFTSPMGRGTVDMDVVIPAVAPDNFKWDYFSPDETIYGGMLKEICSY
ncbi:hypothetical protein OAT35_01680 [Candidatus Pelagibacter sp.]|nr:hypothetical protein [Candidatus Pelagibacter sp.]